MRKVTLLTAVLLCFGLVGAFGQSVDFSFEGEASATFGVDLDEQATGFSNDAEFSLSWTFVEEMTEETGEGDVYGWIELDGFGAEFDKTAPDDGLLDDETELGITFNAPEINAKLFLGPAYIDITDHDAEVDMASQFSEVGAEIVAFNENAVLPTINQEGNAGVAVGFTAADLATVEFGLVSESDHVADGSLAQTDLNNDNAYAMTLYSEITPVEMLTVEVMSSAWFGRGGGSLGETTDAGTANPSAIGASAAYDLPLTSDITLTPKFGVDAVFMQSTDADHELETDIEASLGANLLWPGLGVEDEEVDILGSDNDDSEVTSGVGFGLSYLSDATYNPVDEEILRGNAIGAKLGFYEDSGDDGLLPVVGGAAVFNYNQYLENADLGGNYTEGLSQWGLGVELNATVGPAMPYFGFITGTRDMENNDPGFTLNVGTDLNVISNTTFNIDYVSGDLTNGEDGAATVADNYYEVDSGVDSVGDAPAFPKLGRLEISTTISY